jgi:hypothetical protein
MALQDARCKVQGVACILCLVSVAAVVVLSQDDDWESQLCQ